jgi:hypothetical protein
LTQPSNWSRPQPTNTHRNRRRKHHSPINLELLLKRGDRQERIFFAGHGAGRDRLGLRDRLAGFPSACDPELSTTSIVQMLPSGWIKR